MYTKIKTKSMVKYVFITLFGILFLTACSSKTKSQNAENTDNQDSTEVIMDQMDETAIDDSGEAIADDTITIVTEEPLDKTEQE